jgi:hypothetical protein
MGVYISRFEERSMRSGSRAVEDLRSGFNGVRGGSREPWNMWLRAKRRIGGLLSGVLDEATGSQ